MKIYKTQTGVKAWNDTLKLMQNFTDCKCNLAVRVNNKDHSRSHSSHRCRHIIYGYVLEFHVLVDRSVANILQVFFSRFCSSKITPRQFPSHLLSFPLSTVSTVWWVSVPLTAWGLMAGLPGFASHGSSLNSSTCRSWLPIVEAPGCLRQPTSILAMQLFIIMN